MSCVICALICPALWTAANDVNANLSITDSYLLLTGTVFIRGY
jgi:hypothetical protein